MDAPIDHFRIRAIVPHFEASVADYKQASVVTRARVSSWLNVAYGPGPDETLDLFFPEHATDQKLRPIHLFVHGGYWRANSKSDYSYIAEAIVGVGAIAAIIDYSLLPGARMARLVDQVRSAARWLSEYGEEFGGDCQAMSASGHSAGGHLATYLCCRGPHETEFPDNRIRAILSVSGLYALAPIATSFLQPEIQLTQEEISQWSPCNSVVRPNSSIRLIIGGRESPPFFIQAGAFAGHLSLQGVQPRMTIIEDEDHITIVRSLGRSDSATAVHLVQAIEASRAL